MRACRALAARLLNELARRCARQLQLTLSAGEDVRDYVAARHTGKEGAAALAGCCERIFRALSEYCLRQDSFQPGTAALAVREGALCFSIDGSAPAPLADLLPAAWDGGVEAVRRELDALVGLDEVKTVRLWSGRQRSGAEAPGGRRPQDGQPFDAHDLHRQPRHRQDHHRPAGGPVSEGHRALRGGQLVEVSRGDLVGRYTGHTAPLTNSVIESALGGVLFIDEAYSLYRGEQDSFGLEAIDTLVKGMEDHRDDLVVILAGYTREMQQFLTANSGLARPFPPIRSSSPTTPPTSCWTSPSRWPPPAATVWTTAAPSPCWATTSAGRPPTAAPPATAVWPATPSKRPSTTRAAVWWPSRTPPSI